MDSMFGTARLLSDARFERRELDARTLRRLRAVLTPEQAKEIPQLQPRSPRRMPVGMPGAMPGAVPMVIPAPTPAAPAPKSP
jgi:Spy/CpxP family protein refolding chaperone